MATGPERMIERSRILTKENMKIVQEIEQDIDSVLSDESLLNSEGRPEESIVIKYSQLPTLKNFLDKKERSLTPSLKMELRRIYIEAGWKDIDFEGGDRSGDKIRLIG